MKRYKLTLFGAKDTTLKLAEYLYTQHLPIDLIVSIDSSLAKKNHVADYTDLSDTAKKIHADYYVVNSYSLEKDDEFFTKHHFDIGLVYGWQRLIPSQILEKFMSGIFGFHASPERLPQGRGRSPMNWGLILGKNKLYNHLIKYSKEADRGDIYSVTEFAITPHDTILTLIYKSLLIAQIEVPKLLYDILRGPLSLETQHSEGYFFPKRSSDDGQIDFSTQSTKDIVNLVRGVTQPFPGAFCFTSQGDKIIIWEAWEFDHLIHFSSVAPGTIISTLYAMPVVKTMDSTIIIKSYQGPSLYTGELLSPKKV